MSKLTQLLKRTAVYSLSALVAFPAGLLVTTQDDGALAIATPAAASVRDLSLATVSLEAFEAEVRTQVRTLRNRGLTPQQIAEALGADLGANLSQSGGAFTQAQIDGFIGNMSSVLSSELGTTESFQSVVAQASGAASGGDGDFVALLEDELDEVY